MADINTEVNKLVGENIKRCRKRLNMSAQQLANYLPTPITFQQIQKYENGANRVSAPTLYFFARILGVTLDEFYQGVEEIDHTEYYRHIAEKMSQNMAKKFKL